MDEERGQSVHIPPPNEGGTGEGSIEVKRSIVIKLRAIFKIFRLVSIISFKKIGKPLKHFDFDLIRKCQIIPSKMSPPPPSDIQGGKYPRLPSSF